jgi:hypothetical protein
VKNLVNGIFERDLAKQTYVLMGFQWDLVLKWGYD